MDFNLKNRYMLVALAVTGFISVAAGAFGAHALKNHLTEQALDWWQTGTLYMMFHTLAGIGSLSLFKRISSLRQPALCFIVGNILFSGSLYIMALTNMPYLGMLTPIGGFLYLIGWGLFITLSLKGEPKP